MTEMEEIHKLYFRFVELILALKERSEETIVQKSRDLLSRQIMKVLDELNPEYVLKQLNNTEMLRQWVVYDSSVCKLTEIMVASSPIGFDFEDISEEEIIKRVDESFEKYPLYTEEAEEYAKSVLK